MRLAVVAITCWATIARADLVNQVISRATDLAGPSFQSCGEITAEVRCAEPFIATEFTKDGKPIATVEVIEMTFK